MTAPAIPCAYMDDDHCSGTEGPHHSHAIALVPDKRVWFPSLERAVDRAIAEENRRFLADPAAIAGAQADGERWRKQMEDEGILPSLDAPRSWLKP